MADKTFEITKTVTVEKPIEELRPELTEFRSIADSLERIAEALERKRGLFGRQIDAFLRLPGVKEFRSTYTIQLEGEQKNHIKALA